MKTANKGFAKMLITYTQYHNVKLSKTIIIFRKKKKNEFYASKTILLCTILKYTVYVLARIPSLVYLIYYIYSTFHFNPI